MSEWPFSHVAALIIHDFVISYLVGYNVQIHLTQFCQNMFNIQVYEKIRETRYVFIKDRRRNFKIDNFSIRQINAIMIRLAVAVLVNIVCIKFASKYGSRGLLNKRETYFLPIANHPHFILNEYQEVGQRPAENMSVKGCVKTASGWFGLTGTVHVQ